MSRRARIPPRPPLTRLAIVAFPQVAPLEQVEAFRRRNDPLAASLRAHVTLVFPFASTLSALQVATHARRVATGWPVLPVREARDAFPRPIDAVLRSLSVLALPRDGSLSVKAEIPLGNGV